MTPPREPGPDSARPGLRASLATPDAKAPLRPPPVLDDRRSLRPDHGPALLRTGPAVEAAIVSSRAGRAWHQRRSTWRAGPATLPSRCSASGATTTALDITPRMLELAAAKRSRANPPRWVAGDMMALPFASARFDLVTTGYGIRNVPILKTAIAEIHRVLKPGGLFLSLDFNRPAQCAGTRRLPLLSHSGWFHAGIRAARRPGHVSLHPGIDSTLPGSSSGVRHGAGAGIRQLRLPARARRADGDPSGRSGTLNGQGGP